MAIRDDFLKLILLVTILYRVESNSVSSVCELSVPHGDKLYNFSLASPTSKYPHGVLSEDGFYKIALNGTLLWFQLCDGMVFNHDPPRCFNCQDCGGPSHCGMECSALVANQLGGYYVCTTIARSSNTEINLIDEKNPSVGVAVKMSNSGVRGTNFIVEIRDLCLYCSAKASFWLCQDYISSWKKLGLVGHFSSHSFMPFWGVSVGWYSLSVFYPWSSWYRNYS